MDRPPEGRTGVVATFTSVTGWREAMERALYTEGTGFFVGTEPPARHFRTSVHASGLFAAALGRLLVRVDEALGRPGGEAWQSVLSTVVRGLALCVDYGHLRADRPRYGTLAGHRYGRRVEPVPDGSCDLTAHVAFDALATPRSTLLRQRDALRALRVSGARPPLALASTDPAAYLRALTAAAHDAEPTGRAGPGGPVRQPE